MNIHVGKYLFRIHERCSSVFTVVDFENMGQGVQEWGK